MAYSAQNLRIFEPNKRIDRLMEYNWQHKKWPEFTYDLSNVEERLYAFSEKTGMVSGMLKSLPAAVKTEAIVEIMVAEAVKTSEIEGEFLSRKDVMSSIKNNLGLNAPKEKVADKRAKGIGMLMTDVRNSYAEPLNETDIFRWHSMLLEYNSNITSGNWRTHTEPMQVVSGAIGKETVHYEAPPSKRVPKEMTRFISWFNESGPKGKKEIKNALVRSAVAHLYFESIHPFEDGNGRMGRVIAEKALSQSIGRPVLLSLSGIIERNRQAYYNALKKAQRTLNITEWISYFADVALAAQQFAEELVEFSLKKTRFFDKYKSLLNDRQLKVLKKMFDAGPTGFVGGMNAGKYCSLTKASKATATRDLQDLLHKGAIIHLGESGGRSTKYQLHL